jgi:hypothetical protein
MSNRLVLGIGTFLLFAGDCLGQEFVRPVPVVLNRVPAVAPAESGGGVEYLLKIEEIEEPVLRFEWFYGGWHVPERSEGRVSFVAMVVLA